MKYNDRHCFGIIAQNDFRYTAEYFAERGEGSSSTGRLEGYNIDVFRDSPEDMPVIDYRTADAEAVFQFALHTEAPQEISLDGWITKLHQRPTLAEYLDGAKAIGATITTVRELWEKNTDKRYSRTFNDLVNG